MATKHLADGEVGALVTELEQLARDAAVAPTFVLPGELQDEFAQIASLGWSLAAGSSSVSGPLAPDQLSVPAEQRLRAGLQRFPIRPGQDAADGSQQEAVGRLPAWWADLPLEDTELVRRARTSASSLALDRLRPIRISSRRWAAA